MRNTLLSFNYGDTIMFKLDKSSWFYKNCKRQRKQGAKICGECPFRKWIEAQEAKISETRKAKTRSK